jgi:hypothetical protein
MDMDTEIYDLDSLMIIVEHQREHTYTVRYRFLIIYDSDQYEAVIHALKEKGQDSENRNAILAHLDSVSIKIWSKEGYIEIVDGSIEKHLGIFRLLPKATGIFRA